MTAPRPKRLTRQERLKRETVLRRDQQRARERATHRSKTQARARLAPALEAKLQARAGGRCELCGQALAGRCQRHHRRLRSQGGLDNAANLVLLHPACHHTIHMNPMWAKENGWIVPSPRNPATVPVNLHDRRRVRLTNAGDYEQVAA